MDQLSSYPDHAHLTTLATRVEYLFRARLNPKTGKPYRSADVALAIPGGAVYQTIDKIRSGENTNPTARVLTGICLFFRVRPEFLLFDLEGMEIEPLP